MRRAFRAILFGALAAAAAAAVFAIYMFESLTPGAFRADPGEWRLIVSLILILSALVGAWVGCRLK
jgi:hypothetical protein